MRRLCTFLLVTCLCLLSCAFGATAIAQPLRQSDGFARRSVLEAAYRCGMFEGSFGCRQVPGNVDHGKNATPGVANPPEETPQAAPGEPGALPPVGPAGQVPQGGVVGQETGCQGGMVGTPPNCACPKNSELLGGNCVHYTATCRNGLAAEAAPQVCMGAEEKLACKMRQDGLKDCCCLTYDKL